VLSSKYLFNLCGYRRIAGAPIFTGQLGFCPFCEFFPARICVISALKPPTIIAEIPVSVGTGLFSSALLGCHI